MDYRKQREYVGNLRQLFGVRESRLCGGRGDGVRVVDICNGGDLSVCVAVDRCMDIPEVRFRGRVLNYITPNGIVHPANYNVVGEGWSEMFAGGLLYTCGLCNTGLRSDADWESQKEHGCIANRSAEHLNITVAEDENGPFAELVGTMHEGMLGGVNLSLTRTIRIAYLTNRIDVTDVVRNEGYRKAPHMLLYHCNLGYPLVQPDSTFEIPSDGVRPRTSFAEKMLDCLNDILPPQDEMEEMCYYYRVRSDENGWGHVSLQNEREGLGLTLSFDTATLDHFVQWKNFVKGEYVMGLEPGNCTIDGREDAIARGAMKYLVPGEERQYRLSFRFG